MNRSDGGRERGCGGGGGGGGEKEGGKRIEGEDWEVCEGLRMRMMKQKG